MKKRFLILSLVLGLLVTPSLVTPAKAFDIRGGFADLVEGLEPAVINVFTTQEIRRRGQFNMHGSPFDEFFGQEFMERFFGLQPNQEIPLGKRQSLGSGFIISADGYALTNNHVVENASSVTVKLLDEREFSAKIMGVDKETDVSLLKIETSEKLPFVKLGNSDKLRIGDWVVAIGNPFGLNHTVTAGIVSAKERIIGAGPYDQFIQTDASINPGNSGGPLFNLDGEVVGINTAIIAQGQGIGFAIPINLASNVVAQLKSSGKVSRGWLGVGIQELTPELAESFGLKNSQGALVSQIMKDSPAAKAGLRHGDIITAINGKKIKNHNDLTKVVGSLAPGSKVDVAIIRDGKNKNISIKLSDRNKGLSSEEAQEDESIGSDNKELGLEIGSLSPELRRRLQVPDDLKGVVVNGVAMNSPLRGFLQRGDVIISINRKSINNTDDYMSASKELKKGQKLLLHVWRGGGAVYLVTRLPE